MKSAYGNWHYAEQGEKVSPLLRLIAREEAEWVLLEWIYQASFLRSPGDLERFDRMCAILRKLD